jgi:hypothetical protein
MELSPSWASFQLGSRDARIQDQKLGMLDLPSARSDQDPGLASTFLPADGAAHLQSVSGGLIHCITYGSVDF